MAVSLRVESWAWYALVVFIVLCRITSRALLFRSIIKLRVDDWLMVATLVPYTALIVTINIAADTSSNLIVPGEDVNKFTPQQIANRIYGSKLVVCVEQLQCVTVWSLKACFLFLYYRLTVNLSANVAVKLLAVYIGLSFVVMEILYFAVWCTPFHHYWDVPSHNPQCSVATNHLITNAVFNLSSDVVMLAIGLSLFIRSTLPLNRKLILCAVFSLGIFVILASVLNKFYSFTHPFGLEWTFWYVRESSTGMLVANLPFTWTLLRRVFKLSAFDKDAAIPTVPYHSSRTARGRNVTSSRHGRHGQGQNVTGKFGSHNSSLDMKQAQASPTSAVAPDLPKVQRASWRDKGMFGKDDVDALTFDPWDYGNDDDEKTNQAIGRTSMSELRRESNFAATSPGTQRLSRRIRDEEAQYALEERVGVRCHFYEAPEAYTSSSTSLAASNSDLKGYAIPILEEERASADKTAEGTEQRQT